MSDSLNEQQVAELPEYLEEASIRAAGTWDPMPWHIEQSYRIAGRDAQHAFWDQGNVVAQSLLRQLAQQIAA